MLGWLTPVSHHLYKGDIPENLLKHSERAQISAHSHSSNLLVKWCGSGAVTNITDSCWGGSRESQLSSTSSFRHGSVLKPFILMYSYCATVYFHTNACAGVYLPYCSSCIHNRRLSKQHTCIRMCLIFMIFWSAISFERIVRTS